MERERHWSTARPFVRGCVSCVHGDEVCVCASVSDVEASGVLALVGGRDARVGMTTTKRRVTLRFWNNVLEKVERWTGTQYRSTRLVTPNGRYQYVEQREAKAGRRVAGLPGRAVHWIYSEVDRDRSIRTL